MPASNQLSIAQIEHLLDRRKSRLADLYGRRNRLQKQLEKVEARITSLSGANGGTMKSVSRRIRKRPKNAKSLSKVITEILSKTKQGYQLAELADKVLATGYRSGSSNFKNVLYQALYHDPRIEHDTESRNYRLKR